MNKNQMKNTSVGLFCKRDLIKYRICYLSSIKEAQIRIKQKMYLFIKLMIIINFLNLLNKLIFLYFNFFFFLLLIELYYLLI